MTRSSATADNSRYEKISDGGRSANGNVSTWNCTCTWWWWTM